MWLIRTGLLPGWVVDPDDGFFRSVTCAVDPGHPRGQRTYAEVGCVEPPRPQCRLLDRADAVHVQATAAILLRRRIFEAMQQAGLTGWKAVPVPIRLRDGAIRDDMAELRPLVLGAVATAAEGFRPAWVCRGCGLRRIETGLRSDLAAARLMPSAGDFQIVWPEIERIFVSDRARRILEGFDVEELEFLPADTPPPRWPRRNESPVPADWSAADHARIDALWRDVPKGPPSSMA